MSQKPPRKRPTALRVEIAVSGGVADIKFKSAGVAVAIFDYDVDADYSDRLDRDGEGRLCCVGRWPAHERVSG